MARPVTVPHKPNRGDGQGALQHQCDPAPLVLPLDVATQLRAIPGSCKGDQGNGGLDKREEIRQISTGRDVLHSRVLTRHAVRGSLVKQGCHRHRHAHYSTPSMLAKLRSSILAVPSNQLINANCTAFCTIACLLSNALPLPTSDATAPRHPVRSYRPIRPSCTQRST